MSSGTNDTEISQSANPNVFSADNRPILVTGAGGYLGGRLMERFDRLGIRAIGLGRRTSDFVSVTADLSNREQTLDALVQTNPRCVIHTAAEVPKTMAAYGDDSAAQRSMTMAENVSNAVARMAGVWMLHISSMTVYQQDPAEKPIDERAPTVPQSPYGIGKLMAENAVKETGVNCFSARIPGLYGKPRESGLVENFVTALKTDSAINLPEAPLLWAAMHLEDAAAAIIDLLCAIPQGFQAVNIGYSGPISITRAVEIASLQYGRAFNYEVNHPDFEYDLTLWGKLSGKKPKTFADTFGSYIS